MVIVDFVVLRISVLLSVLVVECVVAFVVSTGGAFVDGLAGFSVLLRWVEFVVMVSVLISQFGSVVVVDFVGG